MDKVEYDSLEKIKEINDISDRFFFYSIIAFSIPVFLPLFFIPTGMTAFFNSSAYLISIAPILIPAFLGMAIFSMWISPYIRGFYRERKDIKSSIDLVSGKSGKKEVDIGLVKIDMEVIDWSTPFYKEQREKLENKLNTLKIPRGYKLARWVFQGLRLI